MKKFLHLLPFLLVAFALLLNACTPSAQPQVTPTAAAPVIERTQAPVMPTPEPSPTALPGKVLLVTPQGIDPAPYRSVLEDLAASQGLLVEERAGLGTADLTPEIRVVVMLAPLAHYADLVSAAPQAQFVIFSPVDLSPAANLSVIRQRIELQAFLAGFVSELLSPDYRAAGLLPADGMLGAQLQEAFVNGGKYYCGVCAPGWPLGLYYPAVAALPAASDGAAWLASAADMFDNKKVDVFFLTPESANPAVIGYLQGKTQLDRPVMVIGTHAPVGGLANQWAASVGFDDLAALREVWPAVTSGSGGVVVDAPLAVDHVNESLLSAGRMRLVEDLLEEIAAGRVHPFTVAP